MQFKKPDDEFSQKFKEDIFPAKWVNPQPAQEYDLLVIGGGPGGMTAATVARTLNAKVALIEKHHLGGECLSYGCIPSKALLRSSRIVQSIRNSKEYGIDLPSNWTIDYKEVVRRVHRLQSVISPHDSAEHLKKMGIDVFLGEGRFTAEHQVSVGNTLLNFKKALIITGTQPIPIQAPGLELNEYWTNQNIFTLDYLPPRLAVIGGGPIACELAQAFLRFGSQVTLITRGKRILPKDVPYATDRLQKHLQKEGMKIINSQVIERIEKKGREKILHMNNMSHTVDEVFVAIGRRPAIEGLDLQKVGVQYDNANGIITNEYLQTSNPDIYASGDVTSPYKFTHISKELAKKAVINALKGNLETTRNMFIPWCTYTDPEVAKIGLHEEEANLQGIATETAIIEFSDVDRAILDGETEGFVKLVVKEHTDQILGATIMAAHAGDLISEIGVAMQSENGLEALAKTVHPFPTQAQSIRSAAEKIYSQRVLAPV